MHTYLVDFMLYLSRSVIYLLFFFRYFGFLIHPQTRTCGLLDSWSAGPEPDSHPLLCQALLSKPLMHTAAAVTKRHTLVLAKGR